jgi:hypothetical protein
LPYVAHEIFTGLFAFALVGNDTSTIPEPIVNYLRGLRSSAGSTHPVRVRIGGNSVDTSTYVPSQGPPMVQIIGAPQTGIAANNQPVTFGPDLFKVLKQVGQDVGGVQYLLGMRTIMLSSHVADIQAFL